MSTVDSGADLTAELAAWGKSYGRPGHAYDEHKLVAAYDAHIAGPRTWSLPPQPGPEVTAVRAAQELYGFTLWHREERDGWVLRRPDGVRLCIVGTWLRLLERFGPVTDASGEPS